MITNTTWDQKDIDKLIDLYNSGVPVAKIAEELDRSHSSVKMYVQRHKQALGLIPRINFKEPAKSYRPQFDREWYGSVPFGHWTITKPWRKVS